MAKRLHTRETLSVESDPTAVVEEPVTVVNSETAAEEVGFKAYQLVYFFLGLVEFLLGLRFVLKLFAANSSNPFVSFIYVLSYPFVLPFNTIFRTPTVGSSVVEWGTIIAMVMYAALAYIVVQLIEILTTKRSSTPIYT